jgi:multidrug efflux pump subunit AcrA (membrane-fusion protein)
VSEVGSTGLLTAKGVLSRWDTTNQRDSRLKFSHFFIDRPIFAISFLGLLALGVFGCGQKPGSQAPPPPTVLAAKPVRKEIVEWQYFTAQTQAVDTVGIIPRVTGYIDNILFKEGDVVNFGDLLYLIDPRPYQAALDQARGGSWGSAVYL